nr:hypothetical protein [Pseudomonas viridiflava]
MAGFKSSLFVMHYFVGKQEDWLAACGGYFGSLDVGDDGVEDRPLFYGAEGEVFVMFSSSEEHILKGQFRANQGNPTFAQQPIFEPSFHPLRPRQ